MALQLHAEVVHVYEQRSLGGTIEILSDKTVDTNVKYTSQKAAAVDGYIFTGWTTSTTQAFENRTPWGCSYNYVEFMPYEDTILTANYVSASLDSDRDGMADGYELYWYGNLSKQPSYDGDGDGYTFSQEVQYGMNPHFFDDEVKAGVVWNDGEKLDYNPYGYRMYRVRSEPEGELFETYWAYAKPGTTITTAKQNRQTTTFAYWKVDGVRQCDEFGRALNQAVCTMPDTDIEIVAVCVSNADLREQYYWYGAARDMNSDSDGDGFYLFEEIAMGTSPLFPDEHVKGITWRDSDSMLYNPYEYRTYTMRSEPEGALFETIVESVRPETVLTTKRLDRLTTSFAQWKMDGVRQEDEFGRALSEVTFTMPFRDVELVAETRSDETEKEQIYWYGTTGVSLDSDTDADGLTFAEEIAQGTNPKFPNETIKSGVVHNETEQMEMNLQPYEQVQGAIVDDQFKHFFTSPIAGNEARSETFGEDLQPIVWDLNSDGLFDLVLVYKGGYKTFVNVGYKGNPEFEERKDVSTNGVDIAMNDVSRLLGLSLDVPAPEDALSATTNGTALLVSDSAGRIWYYKQPTTNNQLPSTNYQLQHKVWGGSHAGFAEGLRLAAVDWDEDGDLDCLAGTAAGKLMLLRDPKVGRPTNLKAEAGIDTVVLTWDPNQQSRIRGYRLYRADGNGEPAYAQATAGELGTGNGDFTRIAEPQLPTYRDAPPEITSYDYKVSSVSRFYTAGNSTPTITESPATEAVRATLGGVTFGWHDVNAKLGERVEVVISIENALNYNVAGKTQSLTYDPEYLRPIEVVKSGITENIEMTDLAQNGNWTVTMSSGVLPAGSGRFLTFVFEALKEGTTTAGGATVTISVASRYFLGDVNGDGVLTKADAQLLAMLKNGNGKWNADELKAGDFNGNGKLDNADYQALRALLKDMGVL